jgi:hypothetical protein
MVRQGIFNSGCFVINAARFREDRRGMGDYLYLYGLLLKLFPDRDMIYYGDQGFMSAAFAGDIKYFGYPETFDLNRAPYNFGVWLMEGGKAPDYTPAVLHLTGPVYLKPWQARFSAGEIGKYRFGEKNVPFEALFRLNARQAGLYETWWRYCAMTPVYGELNKRAVIAARALEEHYLPLCKRYNDLAGEYIRATGKTPPNLLKLKTGDRHD